MGRFVRRLSQRRHSLGAHPSPHRPPLRLFPHNLPLLLIPLLQLPLLPQILLLLILLKTNSSTKSLVFCPLVPRTPFSAQGATLCPRKPAHDPFSNWSPLLPLFSFCRRSRRWDWNFFFLLEACSYTWLLRVLIYLINFLAKKTSCRDFWNFRLWVTILTTLTENLHEFRKWQGQGFQRLTSWQSLPILVLPR